MKSDIQIWLPPHDMHLTLALPVQALIHELQIVLPEHLGQDQVDLHHRKAAIQTNPSARHARMGLVWEWFVGSLGWDHLLAAQTSPRPQRERLARFFDVGAAAV